MLIGEIPSRLTPMEVVLMPKTLRLESWIAGRRNLRICLPTSSGKRSKLSALSTTLKLRNLLLEQMLTGQLKQEPPKLSIKVTNKIRTRRSSNSCRLRSLICLITQSISPWATKRLTSTTWMKMTRKEIPLNLTFLVWSNQGLLSQNKLSKSSLKNNQRL
jgi:hypothetical protein